VDRNAARSSAGQALHLSLILSRLAVLKWKSFYIPLCIVISGRLCVSKGYVTLRGEGKYVGRNNVLSDGQCSY